MAKRIFLPLALIALGAATVAGYQWAKASVAQDIYRDRLTSLQADYQQLAKEYNQAITPRPVTELLVEEGKVCIIVRKGDGEIIRKQTPFNAWENEVYVDYLLVDGRLLIRRVFEIREDEASSKPFIIDGELVEVDWEAQQIPYGKAIYKGHMPDGRWVISVTGDGSLGLKQVSESTEIELEVQPKVKEYEPIDERADEAVEKIGVGDVWRHLTK